MLNNLPEITQPLIVLLKTYIKLELQLLPRTWQICWVIRDAMRLLDKGVTGYKELNGPTLDTFEL